MKSEQKMQVIVEAAGECWHEWHRAIGGHLCYKCREIVKQIYSCLPAPVNPQPTDLNELFRLAEKLFDVHDLAFGYGLAVSCSIEGHKGLRIIGPKYEEGSTPAEALLNALYAATIERQNNETSN